MCAWMHKGVSLPFPQAANPERSGTSDIEDQKGQTILHVVTEGRFCSAPAVSSVCSGIKGLSSHWAHQCLLYISEQNYEVWFVSNLYRNPQNSHRSASQEFCCSIYLSIVLVWKNHKMREKKTCNCILSKEKKVSFLVQKWFKGKLITWGGKRKERCRDKAALRASWISFSVCTSNLPLSDYFSPSGSLVLMNRSLSYFSHKSIN